ncbi:MAG: terpene cyclase/mutase family protein [Planctomycetota bacterium]|jgi:hypothetical protein|nr:terpene cyclase/mutase family protein [Planctomycetota bacterium]
MKRVLFRSMVWAILLTLVGCRGTDVNEPDGKPAPEAKVADQPKNAPGGLSKPSDEEKIEIEEVRERDTNEEPGEEEPVSPMAAHRNLRAKHLARYGGAGTEAAVEAGLRWLRDHQSANGSWDIDGFTSLCDKKGRSGQCSGVGMDHFDTGATGLALLAFLANGHTHRSGSYPKTVKQGLKYLISVQDADGCFGSRRGHFMYNHAIATLAMAEAFGISKSPLLVKSAQAGIDFLIQAQNPGSAWRYKVQPGDNDSSVTGWAVLALKVGKLAGLEVPMNSFSGAKKWYDLVTDDQYYRTGYMTRGDRGARLKGQVGKFSNSEAMTAIAMMARIFIGAERNDRLLQGGADLLLQSLPEWSPDGGPGGTSKIDYYYWYLGTLTMFQMGGDHWQRWNAAMRKALMDHQETGPNMCLHGSWNPVGPWGSSGGRVYTTALAVLTLETYARFARYYE